MDDPRGELLVDRARAEAIFRRAAQEGARRRRRRRGVTVAGGLSIALIVAGVFAWAVWGLRGLTGDTGRVAGADAPNYEFSDVQVRTEGPGTGPGTKAIVAYRYAWDSNEYPGEHDCTAVLYDTAGAEVGRQQVQVSSLTPGPTRSFELEVPISGKPARAELSCDPTRDDIPVAYEISNVRVVPLPEREGLEGGVEVVYEIAWPRETTPPDYPGTNACSATLRAPGWADEHLFTLAVPPGTYRVGFTGERVMDANLSELSATVECHPWSAADLATHD